MGEWNDERDAALAERLARIEAFGVQPPRTVETWLAALPVLEVAALRRAYLAERARAERAEAEVERLRARAAELLGSSYQAGTVDAALDYLVAEIERLREVARG